MHAEGVPATNADIHSEKITIIIYSSLKFVAMGSQEHWWHKHKMWNEQSSVRVKVVSKISPKVTDQAMFNCIHWKWDVNNRKMDAQSNNSAKIQVTLNSWCNSSLQWVPDLVEFLMKVTWKLSVMNFKDLIKNIISWIS